MSASAVRVEIRPDYVVVLTIDQPGSRANVLSASLWAELEAALALLADRTDLRGLVLASVKPGIFVAGADLKFFQSLPGPNDPVARALVEQGLRTLALLESLPFPTTAAIDGAALGGGLELALACDFRVCGTHPRVELGLPEVKLGLIPGWGGTQRLPRLIGCPAALALLHSGESMTPAAAIRDGLADDLVPSQRLVDVAVSTATGIADWRARRSARQNPLPGDQVIPAGMYENVRQAIPQMYDAGVTARLAALDAVYRGARLPLADALAVETEAFLQLAGSAESMQRIDEFFAARKKPSA